MQKKKKLLFPVLVVYANIKRNQNKYTYFVLFYFYLSILYCIFAKILLFTLLLNLVLYIVYFYTNILYKKKLPTKLTNLNAIFICIITNCTHSPNANFICSSTYFCNFTVFDSFLLFQYNI